MMDDVLVRTMGDRCGSYGMGKVAKTKNSWDSCCGRREAGGEVLRRVWR